MQKLFGYMLIFFLLNTLVFFVPWQSSYAFIHNETGELAAYLPKQESFFQIRYTHSIHLSDVVESYEVTKEGNFRITELQYEDFAIGMPANAGKGEVFVEEDGKFFIRNMNRILPEFSLFVGDVDLDLELMTEGRVYDLKEVLQRGESYTFHVEKLSLYQQVKGVKLNEQ
ncbi:DUF1850 domain-containing protein [Planococcus lenghuensis]|uniref:RocC n=1 Tax=Planococcus lenghuensis TaxID=2213202 RepID=A0A1Q2L0D2_9BACL|nr:DUF1850 domain-containing protein [Planococcus lenghuensis]AQQ53891.1 RocC [Planococcus lenghuensis]